MERKDGVRRIAYRTAAILLAICAACLLAGTKGGEKEKGVGTLAAEQMEEAMISLWCPALSFAKSPSDGGVMKQLCSLFPVLLFYGQEEEIDLQSESAGTYEAIVRAEGRDEYTQGLADETLDAPETSGGRVRVDESLQKLLEEENGRTGGEESLQAAQEEGREGTGAGPDAEEAGKQEEYRWDFYEKYDALLEEFYAVDAATAADESLLNLDVLLGKDLSIEKREDEEPQILIYHTHSQEDFADSVPGDASTTILGVGEFLAQLLRDRYGYNVMHHLGQYDVENRDYAYSESLPALEELLARNPSIEVVIDLHRDAVAEGTRLVTEIEGRPTARFMFFNGLSRLRKHGDIDYLPNENLADNLAFSFQMQVLCNEYYPGLTRKIYLKGYRYNMHLKPRYLLVEMGAQTNTYEECYNACIPLARMLDLELSGADFGIRP